MFRPKIKLILLSIASLLLFSLLILCCLLLRYFPDNEISITLFKTVYSSPFSKKALFEFYSPVREDVAGRVPKEINQFLIQRIETTNDEDEMSAIVYFYAIQASGHRIGYVYHISDKFKPKLVNQLIKELNNESNLGGKLMMLEEIRTSKSLGKGSFGIEGISQPNFSTTKEYNKWFYQQSISIVKTKYQEWWNSNLSWEEKRKINPLQDTSIKVSACCG